MPEVTQVNEMAALSHVAPSSSTVTYLQQLATSSGPPSQAGNGGPLDTSGHLVEIEDLQTDRVGVAHL